MALTRVYRSRPTGQGPTGNDTGRVPRVWDFSNMDMEVHVLLVTKLERGEGNRVPKRAVGDQTSTAQPASGGKSLMYGTADIELTVWYLFVLVAQPPASSLGGQWRQHRDR